MIAKAYRAEEVYSSILTDNAPDIMLMPQAGYRINGRVGNTALFEDCQRWAGENDPPGIFIAHGKDIKAGNKLPKMKITDLAPSILHWMDIPTPDDMDGRVLQEIFKEGSEPARREVKMCSGDDVQRVEQPGYDQREEEMVRKRLEDLGYL